MAKNEAHDRWCREHTKRVVVKLNLNTDADIIEKLESEPSMMGYIKALIRADIAKNKDDH